MPQAANTKVVKKLVVIGDGGCGKTCLLTVFKGNEFPKDYVPTVFDNYVAYITFQGIEVELSLWDTAGQEEYDRLRSLSYPHTDVALVCFAVNAPSSLDNAARVWAPELRHFCPRAPFLLVGNKKDLREDRAEAARLAKKKRIANQVRAVDYLECSARTGVGVREVFYKATAVALRARARHRHNCSLL
ncbi:hypothetical protein AAG570_009268 [Ranatra chinensis]|uniref:Rho GTPase n=1 Tax=Ranatra chinensis TaxID=642074 RepID=A0ABD0YT94_9HEMI